MLCVLSERRHLCCLMEQREAPMNKTQSGGRNYTCWKVFTRIVHRNVTQSDESEAPRRDFFKAFTFTVRQKPLPPTIARRSQRKRRGRHYRWSLFGCCSCKCMMDVLIHPWVQPAKLIWERRDTETHVSSFTPSSNQSTVNLCFCTSLD